MGWAFVVYCASIWSTTTALLLLREKVVFLAFPLRDWPSLDFFFFFFVPPGLCQKCQQFVAVKAVDTAGVSLAWPPFVPG